MFRRVLATALISVQALVPAYASASDAQFIFRFAPSIVQAAVPDSGSGDQSDQTGNIPSVTLPGLSANADTVPLATTSPLSALSTISRYLVGGTAGVTYDSVSPSIPGLSLDTATGQIKGTPTAPFHGTAYIAYHDANARIGSVAVPLSIFSKPELASEHDAYELPAAANALAYAIGVTAANDGFYAGVDYSLAPNSDPLPSGLSLTGGFLSGSTTQTTQSPLSIVIRGTSRANALVFADKTLSLTVIPEQGMTLDLKPDSPLRWQFDASAKKVVAQQAFVPAPTPGGSFTAPVTWSLVGAPAWMTVGSDGQLSGTPTGVGTFDFSVQAKDATGQTAADTAEVIVVQSGTIGLTPGSQTVAARAGETFATAAQTASNAVGATVFSSDAPSGIELDTESGVFTGSLASAASYSWHEHATDTADRTDDGSYTVTATIQAPLSEAAGTIVDAGIVSSSAHPMTVRWPAAQYQMGSVTYTVQGSVPGTLYLKSYDNKDNTGLATYTDTSGNQVRQANGATAAATESGLAANHFVFDPATLTLTGIANAAGTFALALHAEDDHQQTGYKANPSDATRSANNSATSPTVSVTVSGSGYYAQNSADSQTLTQYTSQATLTTKLLDGTTHQPWAHNAVWALQSGVLPAGIQTSVSSDGATLTYSGYPTVEGTYGNIVWSVTDSSGATITTTPVSFTVGDRTAVTLSSSTGTVTRMKMGIASTNVVVTAANTANGTGIPAANWTVTGTVPDGITYAADATGLTFSGTPTASGSFPGIVVAATDSAGGQGSISLTFNVGSNVNFLQFNGGANQTVAQYTGTIAGYVNVRSSPANTQYTGGGTFALVSGSLPDGIGFTGAADGSSLSFTGYATSVGTYPNVVFSMTDPYGNVDIVPAYTFTVTARDTLTLTPSTNSVSQQVGKDVTMTVAATNYANGSLDPSAWSLTGTLPPGVSASVTGAVLTIAGTANTAGSYSVVVKATDSAGGTASQTIAFNITTPFVFASTKLPVATKRVAYTADLGTLLDSTTLTVPAAQIVWTWALDPASAMTTLPAGLSLTGSTVSGTPTNSGDYGIVLTASYNGYAQSKTLTLQSVLPTTALTLADATIPTASISKAFSYDMTALLTATGIPKASVVWAAAGGTAGTGQVSGLPAGVTLSPAGSLSGTPTSAGVYIFTVTATFDDTNAQTEHVVATKTYTITSNGAAELAKIDVGDYHSCAITTSGGVKCWGQNTYGQLGNGTNTASSIPVDVSGLTSGVTNLAVGSFHTCAILTSGAVKCWGSNTNGQLGNGTTTNSNIPVAVTNISSGAVGITAADGNGTSGHSCAVMSTGGIKCWGTNAVGQLGNGSTATTVSTPVDVTGLSAGATLVAAGSLQTCAILTDGTVRCWGSNNSGQLGNGTTTNSSVPVVVTGLTGVVALKGGGDNTSKIATCAVTGSGGLKCWGSNSDGQLGNGGTTSSSTPVDVTGLTSGVVSVALGNRHACASLSTGGVKCWGWGTNGQLGNGGTASSSTAVQVSGLTSGVTAVAAGYEHSCAITSTGGVRCWGNNSSGQLGNGTTTLSSVPVAVSGT